MTSPRPDRGISDVDDVPRVTVSTEPGDPVQVAFVGIGPGDPGLLTVRALNLLARASIIAIAPGDRAALTDLVSATTQIVDLPVPEDRTSTERADALTQIVRQAPPGALVARVMADPATAPGLTLEARALRAAGIWFELVPGVNPAAAVASYAGMPMADDGSGLHLVDVDETELDSAWLRAFAPGDPLLLHGGAPGLMGAVDALLAAGWPGDTRISMTERGTTPMQRTTTGPLRRADRLIQALAPGTSAVVVVGAPVELREDLSWFESKPLYAWRVLVPRTQDQAGPAIARLAEYGARAEVVPTIAVEPPRNPAQLDRAINGLVTGRYEWLGFTSANAVKAVREKFDALGLDTRSLAGIKVAAVGGVTAAALRDWGIVADLLPDIEQSAAGLLDAWPEYDPDLDPINRVLLPRADIATDTLVAGLAELGWEVDDVTAYRTVRAAPPPEGTRYDIKSGGFDAVVFTSSSTVGNLVGIAGKPHTMTVVACIGPATAKTATELGLRVDVVAPAANALALVDALAAHGASMAEAAKSGGVVFKRPSQRTRRRHK